MSRAITMKTKPANITAWHDTGGGSNCVALCISHHDMRSTVYLTGDRARVLIDELEAALDRLPAEATAADLGIEGAPV